MKASELMIGDWFKVDDTGNFYQVEYITKELGELRVHLKDTCCFATENDIQPIHLTGEILKKNGFEYHEGRVGMYGVKTADYYQYENSPYIYCDGNPFAVWFEHEVNIQYVHQLQHVLRLCGIDKEIEL